MELERTPVISIRTGDSVKSVKELKQNIADLKDKIVELRNAEKDASAETLQLQAAQRELNAVNGLAKAGNDAVAGSYADLLQQLKQARDEWKQIPQFIDGELNPAYTEATNRVRALTEQVAQMEQATGDWHRNVGNYQSAFAGLASGAGQLSSGLSSIAGTFGIATKAGTPFGNVMTRLQTTIKTLQGASGILGMVKSLGQLTNSTKQSTTASVANTTAKGAEAGATLTLKGAVDLLRASVGALLGPVNLVIMAVSALVSFLPSLISLFKDAKEGADDLSSALANVYTSEDVQGYYDEIFHDRELEIELLKKSGASTDLIRQKELALWKDKQAYWAAEAVRMQREKVALELRLDGLDEEAEGYDELKKRVDDLTSSIASANEQAKNLGVKIEDTPRIWQAEDQGKANEEAKKKAEEARKQAEKALQEAQKTQEEADKKLLEIIESSYETDEKISAKYQKLYGIVEKYHKGGQYTEEQYNQAMSILRGQELDELRNYYKQRYDTLSKGYNDSTKVLRREQDERDAVYKGLVVTLRKTVDAEVAEYERMNTLKKARLEEDIANAKNHLAQIVNLNDAEQAEASRAFMDRVKTNDDIRNLYVEMLADEEAFAEKYPEPFITALKTMGPLVLQYQTETSDALKNHVTFLMRAYEEAIEKEDVDGAKLIRDKLFGDPPIANDAELTEACNDFIARFADKLAEAERKKKPFYQLVKGLSDFMDVYGEATAELLDNTADAWDALLQLQVKNGKMSEEQAQKSFKTLKSLQYASAVIQTAGAVTKALATAPNYVVGAIQAAAALATGTAQIAKIASTEFNGGGGSTSTSAPTALQPTPYVPTVGLNSLDYADSIAQVDTKVYVLESDITDAQNKQKVRIAEAEW